MVLAEPSGERIELVVNVSVMSGADAGITAPVDVDVDVVADDDGAVLLLCMAFSFDTSSGSLLANAASCSTGSRPAAGAMPLSTLSSD